MTGDEELEDGEVSLSVELLYLDIVPSNLLVRSVDLNLKIYVL